MDAMLDSKRKKNTEKGNDHPIWTAGRADDY